MEKASSAYTDASGTRGLFLASSREWLEGQKGLRIEPFEAYRDGCWWQPIGTPPVFLSFAPFPREALKLER